MLAGQRVDVDIWQKLLNKVRYNLFGMPDDPCPSRPPPSEAQRTLRWGNGRTLSSIVCALGDWALCRRLPSWAMVLLVTLGFRWRAWLHVYRHPTVLMSTSLNRALIRRLLTELLFGVSNICFFFLAMHVLNISPSLSSHSWCLCVGVLFACYPGSKCLVAFVKRWVLCTYSRFVHNEKQFFLLFGVLFPGKVSNRRRVSVLLVISSSPSEIWA